MLAEQRPPDGKLHCSGDLIGSLRHAQLKAAGAPTLESELASDTRLRIGTMVHSDFEKIFRGQPVMLEVKLDRWMPEGWSGTADWVVWDAERRCFVLGDLKTIKPEGMAYINRDGMKEAHVWQASAYWWALRRMGVPLLNGFCVYYLPTQPLAPRDVRDGQQVQPSLQEGTPLPQEVVEGRMVERWAATKAYLDSLPMIAHVHSHTARPEQFVTDALAPVQERELKLTLNKQAKRAVINLSWVPNWSTTYCDFPDELCDCSQQGVTKIGHFDRDENGELVYVPRSGQEQPKDIPRPTPRQVEELVKIHAKEG